MMPMLYPATVVSYNRARRMCRIRIEGLTDGGDVMPEAELCNPLGDKSEHTEIRILPGDRVWVMFQGGDARFPVIVGYRPKNAGNDLEWRRFHHENIELEADQEIVLKVGATRIVMSQAGIVIETPELDINKV